MKGTLIAAKYRVGDKLGEGGMGAVFEAVNVTTGRRVAIKIISSEASLRGSEEARVRFERETRAAGAIESQHIAQVLDAGVDPETGSPFMVMELLQGEDLRALMDRKGFVEPDLALRIITQAALGLESAHAAGFIHRDVKPANIFLVRRDAGELVVKVLDFGVAKMRVDRLATREGDALTRTGTLIGSPRYMSPEQARGAKTLDHRADIWGLGAVLYELLGGKTPHEDAESLGELILMLCSKPVAPVRAHAPWVGPAIAAIVERSLRTRPDERYPSMAKLVEATSALLPSGWSITQAMVDEMPRRAEAAITPTLEAGSALERANTTLTSTIPPPHEPETPEPREASAAASTPSAVPAEAPRRRTLGSIIAAATFVIAVAALVVFAVNVTNDAPRPSAAPLLPDAPPPATSSLPSSGPAASSLDVDPPPPPTPAPAPLPRPAASTLASPAIRPPGRPSARPSAANAPSAAPRASSSTPASNADVPGIVKDTSEFGR